MSAGRLYTARDGAIGWIVLDNEARRNAISRAMWQALPEAVAAFDRDPGVRAIVLRGAGTTAFAAGADISEFGQNRGSEEKILAYDTMVEHALEALEGSATPVIAMIHGYCIGGGLEIALSCDLRYADGASEYAIPAARLGLGYGIHGTKRVIETVGHAVAREIFFTARRYDAAEALRFGFVHRVMPADSLEAFVRAEAARIAGNAPLTIAAAKAIIEEFVKAEPHPDFERGRAALRRCMASQDYREGRQAFMQKRKPRFRGK